MLNESAVTYVRLGVVRWAILMLLPLTLSADSVLLRNGSVLQAHRVEQIEGVYRLHRDSGYVELDVTEVVEIERTPVVVAVPPPPVAATPTVAPLEAAKTPEQLLREAARRHGLPEAFVLSVARAESALRTDAKSHKGALGLMQLMPATARDLKVDPLDPEQNVEGGVRLLKELLLKYGQDGALALAAYNAGPGAVARYKGVPPYRETQNYVTKILNQYLKQVQHASKN